MDYEFKQDINGRPSAIFSMGHEAIARWFSDEIKTLHSVDSLLAIVSQLEAGTRFQYQSQGQEFELSLNKLEVDISALTDDSVFDDIPEDTERYDDESYSQCGLQDFKLALLSWRDFLKSLN